MHPDELYKAVKTVVEALNQADLLSAVRQFRASSNENLSFATARLGNAGARLMKSMEAFSANEKQVASSLHLEVMGSATYWESLVKATRDDKVAKAELVQLYSRVLYASTHLPRLIELLDLSKAAPATQQSASLPLSSVEGGLTIQMTDAGERAGDPERIARSIEGIDCLYKSCASIARKPAVTLALHRIDGVDNRELHFIGEKDSIAAVTTVIDSIPQALNKVDPVGDIDLSQVVSTLPIFQEINDLANAGTFSDSDIKEIQTTMHKGALLVLESGVVLVAPKVSQADSFTEITSISASEALPGNGLDQDPHYQNYLKQLESMQSDNSPKQAPSDEMISAKAEYDRRGSGGGTAENLGRRRGDV